MKRLHHINSEVQAQIIAQYKEKTEKGRYRYTLKEIADLHEISLSTVNNMVRAADCKCRPRGGRVREVPGPRIMKILRDASEPFITLEEVGRRNPRVITRRGRTTTIPLSRQRVFQIIKTWKKKLKKSDIHSKGFRPGDKIQWADQQYIVLRYDSPRRGAVIDLSDMGKIDPFCWVFKGSRSRLIEATTEDLTPNQVLRKVRKYVKRDSSPNPEPVNGASNK